jgi:hypothetical protein
MQTIMGAFRLLFKMFGQLFAIMTFGPLVYLFRNRNQYINTQRPMTPEEIVRKAQMLDTQEKIKAEQKITILKDNEEC